MDRKEKIQLQKEYIDLMIKNLPVLRASAELTQAELAEKTGVSRQTMVIIETRKRILSWSLYLAIILVFEQYEDSQKLLLNFELFNPEFIREVL